MKRMWTWGILSTLAVIVPGCIGVDYLDNDMVGARIELSTEQISLSPGGMFSLEATYFNEFGIEEEVMFMYNMDDPDIAAVDNEGKVTGVMAGMTQLFVSYNGLTASPVNVNVVGDPESVASVQVNAPTTTLVAGEKVQLTVVIRNILGEILQNKPVEWFSENASLATVSATGEVTALSNGVVEIHAKSEGVKSNGIIFTIGESRTGIFVPSGGYIAEGMGSLRQTPDGIVLELSPDFKTSFALGTFIYLANSTNGASVKSAGIEISQITSNGARSFNLNSVDPNIGLYDYRYIVVLCKPATLTFGYADLN